ncbi:hypothetical protein BU23DRAFT_473478, partial [Bimuria novae-zelandiae CBS 107.79]
IPPKSAVCYCSNCVRAGSGPCSIVFILDRSTITLNDPSNALKTYEDSDTLTGNRMYRSFCGNCGSPVYTSPARDSPMLFLQAGLFDKILEPAFENMPEHKPAWVAITKG